VAATALIVVVLGTGRLEKQVGGALAILAVPLVALALTALSLGQLGGHPIESGRFSLLQNLLQVSNGIGSFVLPRPGQTAGLICALLVFGILVLYALEHKTRQLSFLLVFAGDRFQRLLVERLCQRVSTPADLSASDHPDPCFESFVFKGAHGQDG